MPKSEDIYRDPKELEALKAKVKPEEYLKTLYEKITSIEEEIGKTEKEVSNAQFKLREDFEREKMQKEQIIAVLDNTIALKRSKREEAERPFIEIQKELDVRAEKLLAREKASVDEMQKAFHMEQEAQNKLTDVQALSDQLGETRVRQLVKEESLKNLEKALKHNENQYLLKIDRFSHEMNESTALLQERENAMMLRELNLQGKEDNLVKREKELLDGHIWLNDQRGVLERAWVELRKKENGKSTTTPIVTFKKRP